MTVRVSDSRLSQTFRLTAEATITPCGTRLSYQQEFPSHTEPLSAPVQSSACSPHL